MRSENAPLNFAAVRAAHPLVNIAQATIKLDRAGCEWKGCCPFHADKSPSFTIYAAGHRFHCFGCGVQGDVLDFVQRLHGVGLRDAAILLTRDDVPAVELARHPEINRTNRIAEAREIWRSATPAAGTLAESYLRSRGIRIPIPKSIRFARLPYRKLRKQFPVLVAAIASADDQLQGIQRIYLNESGTRKAGLEKPKLSLGRITGGAIRFGPLSRRISVTEGLEDALTLQQQLGFTAWASCGATMLPRLILPPDVSEVVVGGDDDSVGRHAAAQAVASFRNRGIHSRAIFPVGGKDFNAQLMKELGL